ncbi:MAG: phosphoribosylaminoimidazolesuccinocarboxamide synthase [Elusimicrobia bacterium]|nr:phosphoribosylaminoimidazolesuccinocarboxamide synthase [Elusimicrobiota bacterium]
MTATLVSSEVSGLKLLARGKVRDIYDLGDRLLLVATDRLSAFDHVLPTPVPDKGCILTQMSAFWFKRTAHLCPNHLVSADFKDVLAALPSNVSLDPATMEGRVMLVRKAERFDIECVVRGYLAGSGWREYQEAGRVCGHALPPGLKEAAKLPQPIFTPSTKAEKGHDENIPLEEAARLVGSEAAREIERLSLALYRFATAAMEPRGLILADTKFEFGLLDGKIIAIDEMVTPDSSRFWDAQAYRPGRSPENFDKQFVRDYLNRAGWDKNSPPPPLPPEVVEGTARRYREAFRRIES